MNTRSVRFPRLFQSALLAASFCGAWRLSAQEVPPLLPAGAVTLTAEADRSTLNRVTGQLTSTVDLKAVNAGSQQIDGPLHALVKFRDSAGQEVRAGITVPGTQGGFGVAPWQVPYFDLSAKVPPGGWQPGQEIAWTLNFTRHRTLAVTYEISLAGRLNHEPVANAGGPYSGSVAGAIAFAASATDPDNDPLTFLWRFDDGTTAETPQTQHAFALPGLHEISLTVTDGRGGENVKQVAVAVTPDGPFALGRTRVLDGTGHPLPGAAITETGPGGERTFNAGAETAFASLGGLPGTYIWRFEAPGHLPAWRTAELTAGAVILVPSPWLAKIAPQGSPVSVLDDTRLASGDGSVALLYPAGAFPQAGDAVITPLSGQSLPAPLPLGWSPLASFHLDLPDPGAQADAAATLRLPAPFATGRVFFLTRYDRPSRTWMVLSALSGNGTSSVAASLRDAGDYALALADAAPTAPPAPAAGEPLAATAAASALPASGLTAIGNVTPDESPASTDPERVTGAAIVDFTSPSPLPSGVWFRTTVEETYDLKDGRRFRTPDYDTTFFAWHGVADTNPATLRAGFPMRPRLLFGPDVLSQARVHVEVLAPGGQETSVFSTDGGLFTAGKVRLTVPAGAVGGLATAELRALDIASFTGFAGGLTVADAFALDLAGLLPGSELGFSYLEKLDALSDYVLARAVTGAGVNGLQPVLRLRSDAAGFISTVEPATAPRLPGIDRAGQYLIVKLTAPQGLVTGLVRLTTDNSPAAGAVVRVSGQPWMALTPDTGGYALLTPAGSLTATAVRDGEGFTGRATAEMPAALTPVTADILLGSAAPFVLATNPTAGATKAPVVTPVTVTFSERISPASFATGVAVSLLDPANAAVPASLALDLTNRIATLLPLNSLAAATDYKIVVSADLRDLQNLVIEGPREFSFTTAAPAARGIGAQLTIYEPGGAGPTAADRALINAIPGYTPGTDKTKVVAVGNAGSADPDVPVILVNESTGATATVLSKPDGSFANFIDAAEEDFITATFVNTNGTRISIPASRQKFDDGRVGLFQSGGILEAENDEPSGTFSGPVSVGIPPDAIADRVVFEIDPVPLPQLLAALEGSLPEGGTVVAGVTASHEGAVGVEGRAQIEFTIDATKLTLPEGITRPEDMTFILTSVQELDGVLVYEAIDTMAYVDGKLTSRVSPPDELAARTAGRSPRDLAGPVDRLKNVAEGFFNGLTFPEIAKKQFLADVKAVLGQLSFSSLAKMKQPNSLLKLLGLPGVQETIIHQLLLPIAMAQGHTTNIGGRVSATKRDADGIPVAGTLKFVAGAVVSLDRPPGRPAGRLRPGEIVALTNRDGTFMMRMDVGLEGSGFLIGATHPRFPGQRPFERDSVGGLMNRLVGNVPDGGSASGISGANVTLAKLQFTFPNAPGTEGPDETPPALRASHVPVLPLPGIEDADPGASLTVSGVDGRDVTELLITLETAVDFNGVDFPTEEFIIGDPEDLPVTGPRLSKRVVIKCARPGRITVLLEAADGAGNRTQGTYAIDFGRPAMVPEGDPGVPPRVLSMFPAPGSVGNIAFPEIRLNFSKKLPAEAFEEGQTDWLLLDPDHFVTSITPDATMRGVVIRFGGLESGPVSVTVGTTLTDEGGHALDQNPDEEDEQAFVANFSLAAPAVVTLDLLRGGGAGLLGGYLFTLDRPQGGDGDGKLVVYDLADPLVPVRAAEMLIPGDPGDLVVMPRWSVIPRLGDNPVTRPFVAVIGGSFGSPSDGNAGAGFKTLRLIDVSTPAAPKAFARGNVSFDPASRIVKLTASPPFIAYQEQTTDVTSVHLVDLAAFVLGHNSTEEERLTFPTPGTLGLDLNGDGDFTDSGERNSEPDRQAGTFFGDVFSWAPESPRERLVDFSLAGHGLLGVITSNATAGQSFFRSVFNGGDPFDPAVGRFTFTGTEDPKRVTIVTDMVLRVAGQRRLMDLALVSLRTDAAGKPALLVLDLSDPKVPVRLGQMNMTEADGVPNTLVQRDGTTLVLATTNATLLLDSERLLETDSAGHSLAIRGRLAGFGGGVRSFVADLSGLAAIAASGRNQLAFTGPAFEFVTLPGDPQTALSIAELAEDDAGAKLAAAEQVSLAQPASVTIDQQPGQEPTVTSLPRAADHYYVVCRAPGGAGGAAGTPGGIDLTLSTVSVAGTYPALDASTVLPRLLVDQAHRDLLLPDDPPADAYPLQLRAHRLSNDPASQLYNIFLAGPVTLHPVLSRAHAKALTAQLERNFFRIDKCLYAGLAPRNENLITFLTPYQPAFANGVLQPSTGRVVPCNYQRNPLIFVPGVMASKLRGDRSFDLWLSVPNVASQTVLDGIAALARAGVLKVTIFGIPIPIPEVVVTAVQDYFNAFGDLVLAPDGTSANVHATDVLRDVFLVGNSVSLSRIQGPLLEYLHTDMGYREYEWDHDSLDDFFSPDGDPNEDSLATLPDLFPFPYDWRLDCAKNAERLAKYVDLIKESNPDVQHVDVIAHSMGGLITRRYMMDHPGVVATFISACSPYLGAPKAINSLKTGDMGEFMLNFAVGLDLSRQISRHMPALHQLMPSRAYFDLGGRPVAERGWDADGNGNAFETLDYNAYRKAVDGQLVYDPFLVPPKPIAANNEPFHTPPDPPTDNSQDDWRGEKSGTRIFHVVSVMQKPETITRVRLMPRLIPVEPPPDVSLNLPSVEFEDSEQLNSSDEIILSEDQAQFPAGPSYRLEYGLEVDRGVGDGTVPLLSQTRGFGSADSLNAPGTVMLPLVSPDPRDATDKLFSHAGMLLNPDFFQTVQDILLGNLALSQQPKITLTVPASADEGDSVSISAVLVDAPADLTAEVIWDTGDGGFIEGLDGEHVFHEDGTYTVTCVVGFPGTKNPGAVASARITVGNKPPTAEIRTEGELVTGETVRLIAVASDPGSDDGLTYQWTITDGTQPPPGNDFLLPHVFAAPGSYTVNVLVTDGDGGVVTATTEVKISAPGTPAARGAPRGAPRGQDLEEDPPPVEFVQVVIGGHDVLEAGMPKVKFSSQGTAAQIAAGTVDEGASALLSLRSVDVSPLGARSTEMRVYRLDPGGSATPPNSTDIIMKAAAFRIDVRLLHHRSNGIVRAYEWQVSTEPDDEVTLTLKWNDLATGTIDDLADFMVPRAFNAHTIPAIDVTAPAIAADFDDVSYNLLGLDLAISDGEPQANSPRGGNEPTLVDERPALTVADPPDADLPPVDGPGGNEFPTLEGEPIPEGSIVTEVSGPVFPGSEPNGVTALMAMDGAGMLQFSREKVSPPGATLTQAKAKEIRDAVEAAFTTGATQPFYKKFVVSHSDLLLFEQGTGAALWKNFDKAVQAYTPGQSDNDYEIFFPAIISPGNRVDPAQPADVAEFESHAYEDEFMQGDWYFRPPAGLHSTPSGLEPVPLPADENDSAQLAAYIAAVDVWRYTVPALLRTLDAQPSDPTQDQVIDIARGFKIFPGQNAEAKSVFDNPAAPSSVIAFVLTENLKRNAGLRAVLTDVSFFPFRREHFLFGLMSLEKPPPFGDDPVGDAGMGRGLLLLKWVLEGAILPPVGPFNTGQNDVGLRTAVFNRLKGRAARLEPEGLEWGLYQEFAALSESAHLHVAPVEEDGTPIAESRSGVFADYFSAHDKKTVKKVGKAAIRGVLARLATEDNVRSKLFDVAPAAFDADATLPSFEHLVARLGRDNVNVFGGGNSTAELIDDFLAAKVGKSNDRLKALLASPATIESFIHSAFDFLREKVQEPTLDDYDAYLDALIAPPTDSNRLAEHRFRTGNAVAIDLGFPTSTGGFRPGRLPLHGVQGVVPLKYKFVLSVRNDTPDDPVRATVRLDDGVDNTPSQTVVIDVPSRRSVNFPDPENPALSNLPPLILARQSDDFQSIIGKLNMTTAFPADQERTRRNNIVFFEHRRIPLGVFRRDGNGRLVLGLVPGSDNANPPGTCTLTVSLVQVNADGSAGGPVPNATLSYFDNDSQTHSVSGGQVLLSRGVTREPIKWPIIITGTAGTIQMDAVEINADVTNVFLRAAEPTHAQREFLNIVRDAGGPFGALRTRPAALAPSCHAFYSQLDAITTQAALDTFLRAQTGRFFIRRNEDIMANGMTVADIVSGGTEVAPQRGLFMVGLLPGHAQTQPFSFGPPADFNPGRGGKRPPLANRQFTGDIFLDRDLFDRCAPPVQSLDFTDPGNGNVRSFDCVTLVKSELFHEFNVRLLDILGDSDNNVLYDSALRGLYPNLNQAHSFLFRVAN